MTDHYPVMPKAYEEYIREGIELAESELENDFNPATRGEVIPGQFTSNDNIPPELVEAVIWRESEFNPTIVNTKGYCNDSGGRATGLGQFCLNPGGDPGGSLELSDYQALTGKKLNQADVMDPKRAIHLVAFGLGDRYSRLKNESGGKTYNDWYRAMQGYSPITEDQYVLYKADVYDYIAAKYGVARADDIQFNAGREGGKKACDDYSIIDPRRYLCTAGMLADLGQTVAADPGNAAAYGAEQVLPYATKFLIYALAGAAVLLGAVLLFKKFTPTSIVARTVAGAAS